MPTRLLDWSESPLAALWFAVQKDHDGDSALWALFPTKLNHHAAYRPEFPYEIPSFHDDHLQNYRPSIIASESRTSLLPVAAIAPRNSPRMQAQLGVFTISHRESMRIDDEQHFSNMDHVAKFNIPQNARIIIKDELKLLGFNEFTLFPELGSLCTALNEE